MVDTLPFTNGAFLPFALKASLLLLVRHLLLLAWHLLLIASCFCQENGKYLAKHEISEYLTALVTTMLIEKPSNPFRWMRAQLDGCLDTIVTNSKHCYY